MANERNNDNKNYNPAYSRVFSGRTVITTGLKSVDDSNIAQAVNDAMGVHTANQQDIEYLYNYYKGEQPIRFREKEIRPEIRNDIVENRANEIVSFYTSYQSKEPITFVSTAKDGAVSDDIAQLNDMMREISTETINVSVLNWLFICGTAYKMVTPVNEDNEDVPFSEYALDPRNTFVVYSRANHMKPLFAVTYYVDENNVYHYSVYAKNYYWEILNNAIVPNKSRATVLSAIPIIEYPANDSRIGAFELVLPLLDGLNVLESNRLDAVESFVQYYMEFKNVDIDEDEYDSFLARGAIKYYTPEGKDGAVNLISNELNQSQVQILKDDIYRSIFEICGVPVSENASSYSDTGASVTIRGGWVQAEARAKMVENFFKRSERQLMKLVLEFCKADNKLTDLKLMDFDIKFTRNNYEAIQSKSQVLCQMLNTEKIHPEICFEACGMFPDPEDAYLRSKEYIEEKQKEYENDLEKIATTESDDEDV